jgi:protein involved in polysaccharide export with SLBB domain
VHRPAIYELKGNTSVADIIRLAGGLTSEADPSRAALVRVNDRLARVVVNVPLGLPQGPSELLAQW